MDNSEHEFIDAQFTKAVSIVQSLPKTGPIQTDYEEKLVMYSLYKQATVGNVRPPRPGIWDMLGRAKWDAWAKQKGLPPHQAKLLYVETLLRVLQKYSDKTIARDLVRELESYGNLSESFTHLSNGRSGKKSPGSSGSESAAEAARARRRNTRSIQHEEYIPSSEEETTPDDDDNTDDHENATDRDEDGEHFEEDSTRENAEIHPSRPSTHTLTQSHTSFRPPSSLSSQTLMRYRTPMAGSMISAASGIPGHLGASSMINNPTPGSSGIPSTQPMPAYTTPSAFGGDIISQSPAAIASSGSGSLSASTYVPGAPYPTYPYVHQQMVPTPLSVSTRTQSPNGTSVTEGLNLIHDRNTLPYNTIPLPAQACYIRQYDSHTSLVDPTLPPNGSTGVSNPLAVEKALANVQAHIAALSERVEMLEAITNAHGLSSGIGASGASAGRHASLSSSSLLPGSTHSLLFGSSFLGITSNQVWDPTQLGLWSSLVGPLSRTIDYLRSIAAFLIYVPIEETHLGSQARDRDPRFRSYSRRRYSSPSLSILLIIRRLILDVSFMFSFIGLVRFVWKRTGLKRRVFYSILEMVWRAVMGGERKGRVMVDRGV